MNIKFFICSHCKKIITQINENAVPVICCGEKMQELLAGTTEASLEKHLPVYKLEGNKVIVSVGSISHPMTEEHFIEWVILTTNKGYQLKKLQPNEAPQVEFALLENETINEVYAYCNLHSLWKA